MEYLFRTQSVFSDYHTSSLQCLLVSLACLLRAHQTRSINSSVCGRSTDFPNTNTPRVAPVNHSHAVRTTLTDFGSPRQRQCEPNGRNGRNIFAPTGKRLQPVCLHLPSQSSLESVATSSDLARQNKDASMVQLQCVYQIRPSGKGIDRDFNHSTLNCQWCVTNVNGVPQQAPLHHSVCPMLQVCLARS
jgi:hypothetical protein